MVARLFKRFRLMMALYELRDVEVRLLSLEDFEGDLNQLDQATCERYVADCLSRVRAMIVMVQCARKLK